MINHSILLKKLRHIGFENSSINLIRSYLKGRKQKTFFNGSYSSYKEIGENSSFQGTIMATLWYVIYVLDQPAVIHMSCDHEMSEDENINCQKNLSLNFVDDNNSVITSNNWNTIINVTESYLNNQKQYHDNNELLLNEEKTIIMINSKNKKIKQKSFKFGKKTINHSSKFVVLGLVYNDKLNFHDHLSKGTIKNNQ